MQMADRNGRQTTSPCAACKLLRRRCTETCVLAPFFPQNDPQRFADAHRVFGASNIVKMIEDIPMDKRADGVSSMVYEARARLRDPVYGCAGTVWQLQQQVSKLQSEKAMLQAELLHMHLQQANLAALIMDREQPLSTSFESFSASHNKIFLQGHTSHSPLYKDGSDEQDPHLDACDPLWK
ncbi:hypothetical protein SUGI_0759910 [Cryptomeria japonica]|uniref:LOB domain-containing protein 1 n=1 Tax=Cryptomeria japonica TaxID=3369 RepID=UPI00241474FA|nr:LOB domain-containing protein 1 [Cryptomeria japonica]GLJ37410.1 hypothetical protein SUGI_0759910 [Cryptomeria japonica]